MLGVYPLFIALALLGMMSIQEVVKAVDIIPVKPTFLGNLAVRFDPVGAGFRILDVHIAQDIGVGAAIFCAGIVHRHKPTLYWALNAVLAVDFAAK